MLYSAKWIKKEENISLEIKHLYLKIKNRKLYKKSRNNGKRAKLKKKKRMYNREKSTELKDWQTYKEWSRKTTC